MILMDTTIGRGFVTCAGFVTPKDGFIHPNDSNGVTNQWVYLFSGSLRATVENGDVVELPEKAITDMSPWANMRISYDDMGTGAQYLAINPVPNTLRYSAELLKGPIQKTIVGTSKLTNIVSLEHTITCNDVTIQSRNFATVPEGKEVAINVPENSVALIITEQ
jgi:hypothetical protein